MWEKVPGLMPQPVFLLWEVTVQDPVTHMRTGTLVRASPQQGTSPQVLRSG